MWLNWWLWGFLEILRPNLSFFFHIDLSFKGLVTVSDVNQRLSLILPSGDFPGDGCVVPFIDAIHDKFLIEIQHYVILFRIERRSRWGFRFDTVKK